MNAWNDFNKCVTYSLSEYNPNPKNLFIVMSFLKKIFIESNVEKNYRFGIVKQVMKAYISGTQIDGINEISQLGSWLNKEFLLMPLQRLEIYTVIEEVLEEIAIERGTNTH